MAQTENKNEKLKAFLEEMYGKELADSEIQEHKEKLVKLFSLFVEIDQRNKKKK